MIINNLNKQKLKILLDKEDLESFGISLENWLTSPSLCLQKILTNFPNYKNIDIKSKEFNIYTFKFITFYIIIE